MILKKKKSVRWEELKYEFIKVVIVILEIIEILYSRWKYVIFH